MKTYTDRIVLVFPIADKNRSAAASLQTLSVLDNGREIEDLVPLDPSAVAEYVSEFNLPLIAELDAANAVIAAMQSEIDRLVALVPDEPVSGTPQVITRTQARLILYRSGLIDDIEAAVSAGGKEMQIWYEAAEWHRTSKVLIAFAESIGMDAAKLDELFVAASQIVT